MVEKCRIGRHLDEATYTINDARGFPWALSAKSARRRSKANFDRMCYQILIIGLTSRSSRMIGFSYCGRY